jgi:hypothetical protein
MRVRGRVRVRGRWREPCIRGHKAAGGKAHDDDECRAHDHDHKTKLPQPCHCATAATAATNKRSVATNPAAVSAATAAAGEIATSAVLAGISIRVIASSDDCEC